jgi:hypothetical protein
VKQSIGKRYARMDEAGTPFCFTIDGQTKEDGTVTVRNRDDASQDRIPKQGCLAIPPRPAGGMWCPIRIGPEPGVSGRVAIR